MLWEIINKILFLLYCKNTATALPQKRIEKLDKKFFQTLYKRKYRTMATMREEK